MTENNVSRIPCKFDLHVHSTGSFDSNLKPKQIISRARNLGLRGISVTDHDRLTRIRNPYTDLLVVPGMEIRVYDGELCPSWGADLLAIGIDHEVEIGLDLHSTIEAIHDAGGAVVIPHPFSSKDEFPALNEGVYNIAHLVEGIEVMNPKKHLDNIRARKLSETFGLARIGGSDAHTLEHLGRVVTVLENVHSSEELMMAIRDRRCRAMKMF